MIRILIASLIIGSSLHDFHYSKTVSDYNTRTKTLQTVTHLFTDDIENAVKMVHDVDLRLGEQDEYAEADSLIRTYVLDNFEITTDSKSLKLEWIGFEFDYDIVYTYIESEPHEIDSTYAFRLNFLNEIFDDQENFVKLKLPNQVITSITSKTNTLAKFDD